MDGPPPYTLNPKMVTHHSQDAQMIIYARPCMMFRHPQDVHQSSKIRSPTIPYCRPPYQGWSPYIPRTVTNHIKNVHPPSQGKSPTIPTATIPRTTKQEVEFASCPVQLVWCFVERVEIIRDLIIKFLYVWIIENMIAFNHNSVFMSRLLPQLGWTKIFNINKQASRCDRF